MKKHLLLILILIISTKVFADCPHCYRIAQVKIIYKSGNMEFGYIPLYSEEININKNFENGQELLNQMEIKRDFISYSNQIYSRIPYFENLFKTEEIQKINVSEIKSIEFVNWITYGASKLHQANSDVIDELLTKKIVYYKLFKGTVNELYITTDSLFDSKCFDIFLNIIYGEEFKYSPLKSWRNKYKDNDLLDSNIIKIIKNDINAYKLQKDIYLNQLSHMDCSNEQIKRYIEILNSNHKIEKEYLDLCVDFLETHDKEEMQRYIDTHLPLVYSKTSLQNEYKNNYFYCIYNEINDKDYLKYFIKLLRVYNLFGNHKEKNTISENIFKSDNLHKILFYQD